MTRIKIVKVYIAAVVAIVILGQGLELVVAVAATKTFHVNFLGMWTIASALGNYNSLLCIKGFGISNVCGVLQKVWGLLLLID